MLTVALVSHNSWFATSVVDLMQQVPHDEICILTDPGMQSIIDGICTFTNIDANIRFFHDNGEMINHLNRCEKVYCIFDHPLRSYETHIISKVRTSLTIIELEHGLSIAIGLERVKKALTNFVRRIRFIYLTRQSSVHRILIPRASGLLYLEWLSRYKYVFNRGSNNSKKMLLFATSGAGRYKEKNFQVDTRLALRNAKKLSNEMNADFALLAKNNENISYLEKEIVGVPVFKGGLVYLLWNLKRDIGIICHDQSTLVLETNIIGLKGWTYSARFKSRKTYEEVHPTSKSPSKVSEIQSTSKEVFDTRLALQLKQQLLAIFAMRD